MNQLTSGSSSERDAALRRYLTLLEAGGSDHPMTLLRQAGVDLGQPEPIRAVVAQLDTLVSRLEQALNRQSS
jgi:oligoendopeptidase F